MIRVEIDLLINQVTRYSNLLERSNVGNIIVVGTEDGVPEDYDINRYDYIPVVPGEYSPVNFRLRQTNSIINFERRQLNVQRMTEYMFSFVTAGQLTQANFDLFLSDTSTFVQQYLTGGGRLITWIETVNRNGYNATTVGFKTRTAYRGPSSNGIEGVNGNYVRANTILGILNDL
jgi:hypothetical protein